MAVLREIADFCVADEDNEMSRVTRRRPSGQQGVKVDTLIADRGARVTGPGSA